MIRVIGIDPGLAIVGYGILDFDGNKFKPVDYGMITTDANISLPVRLNRIHNELIEIINKYCPDQVAIEELFFNKNVKTAITVGQARGVIINAITLQGVPTYEYTPLQVKQGVTGYGRATKQQVQQMIKLILKLEKIPKPDDVADALAVAINHLNNGRLAENNRIF